MPSHAGRLRFWIKPVIAILLVALADRFFYGGAIGSTLGVFGAALLITLVAAHPALRHDARARGALASATLFSLILFDAPSFLGWALLWVSLALAVLSPRARGGLDAATWLLRLTYLAFAGSVGPVVDTLKINRVFGVHRGVLHRFLTLAAVPVIGGAIFLLLFASANPVIGQYLGGLRLPKFDLLRLSFWLFCLVGVWSLLRPRFLAKGPRAPTRSTQQPIPGISVASVGLSLCVFNALFALQNGLDLAFLWSGATLPQGVTLADYAHRGAYPLIATALLAGVFVIVALRPGASTARSPWLRRLVILWVVQNVLLVGSSILRTLDYIEAFSLTRLRIAALLWMGLVAVGLVLIGYRMIYGKTSAWLINANVLAAGLVLAGSSIIDFGAVAADWNVGHAREVGGSGPPLDLCYLAELGGSSAVVPLSNLERGALSPPFRDRVSQVRSATLIRIEADQARWRSWNWRDQRRLDRARALYPEQPPVAPVTACR
jgi:hypothetical protein